MQTYEVYGFGKEPIGSVRASTVERGFVNAHKKYPFYAKGELSLKPKKAAKSIRKAA